jgi:uncharacterized protein YhaN
MRLLSLTLENYGIFRAQRIAFDPTPGRINLLIAPNGAGKSILRNAFCDLLFGIHGQTPMGFRYGYGRMRLLAEAVCGTTTLVFGRRKGQGNTLIGADGATLDPAALAGVLGQTDRTLTERLFALDTERLRRGGEELLASNGSVADALLSAAGGLRHARQVHQSLENMRDALAPLRRSQGRPFYQSLDRMLETRQLLSTAVLKPEIREKQQTELAHLQAEQERCNKLAQAASQRIARLERIRRVVGVLAEHDAAAAWLDAHPDAPDLPADAGERLAKARDDLLRAEQFLERAQNDREPIAEQAARVEFDAAMLAQGEAIEQLVDRAGVARQAALDRPKREVELAVAADRIAGLLRALGLALPVERAGEAVPARAVVVQARRLATDHEKLRGLLAQLPAELAQAEKDQATTEAALAALPPALDTRVLARLLREIRAAGEPDRRIQDAARVVADRRTKRTEAVARVRGWQQGADALIALTVLPLETYERLHAALSAAETTLAAAAKEVAELRGALAQEATRLRDIAGGQTMPDDSAIRSARAHRDIGWRLIYRRAFTSDPPDAAQEHGWADELPLPLAFERAVAAADELADRRNREGERVAQASDLARRIADLESRVAAAEATHAAAVAPCDEARAAWQEACAGLALSAQASIAELRALMTGRERVIDADAALADAVREQVVLEQRHAGWAERLIAELDRCAVRDLPELLAMADERIDANKRTEDSRVRLQERLLAQRNARDDKAARLRAAEHGLDALMLEWTQVRRSLQRPDTEDPATTVALLELLNELDKEQQTSTGLRHRLREMQEEIASFQSAAADLASRLAADLAGDDAFTAVQALRQRLTEHRALGRQHETLATALKRADTAVVRQQKVLDDCRVELRTVLGMIGGDSAEAAQARVALATERAQMQAAVRRAEHALLATGDGLSLAQLRAETASISADDIPGAIERAREEHDAANREAQALAARVATSQADMDRQAAENTATQAAVDQQAAAAALHRIAEEATLMHLAAALLDAALTEVEMAGTTGLLSRIAELFRTITGGAYARLEVDENSDGSARLIAVHRDFADERKGVADLSEGERDQLFLALRLAAIEDHVATAPPLPFIGDDILQTFDDDRATAAMQALLQLSEKVQVILLSHHRNLAALGQRLAPERVHLCDIAGEAAGVAT